MFKNNVYTSFSPTPKLMKSLLMLLRAQVLTVEVLKYLFMLSISVHIPDLENVMIEVQSVFLLNCHVLFSETVRAALPVLGITYLTSKTVIG